ncbi:hypothetical protein AXG93_1626s1140 [Marchantia polymorpha subsp. ruderalis]|uniref:Uncharacterized protein n=1 Tax=Marchantia polymorpha subsp. ruderalis TaxID=1480154 RepID=A0A176W7Q0_MARPO|nr:hypothetical protein AXG93_1626s1140 [Marchantia polymorpha subsp. ruderalis]
MLAGHEVEAAAEEAMRPSARESSRILAPTENLGVKRRHAFGGKRSAVDELVRKTQTLEKSEAARRADEELLGRLQLQCKELRAQRAAAKVQLAEVEDHNRRAADCMLE